MHWQVSHRVTRIELDTPDQVTWADGGDSKPSYRKVTKIEVWGGNSHNSYTKLTPELDVQVCHYYLSLHKNKWPRTKTVYSLGIYIARCVVFGSRVEIGTKDWIFFLMAVRNRHRPYTGPTEPSPQHSVRQNVCHSGVNQPRFSSNRSQQVSHGLYFHSTK